MFYLNQFIIASNYAAILHKSLGEKKLKITRKTYTVTAKIVKEVYPFFLPSGNNVT